MQLNVLSILCLAGRVSPGGADIGAGGLRRLESGGPCVLDGLQRGA